MLSAVFSAMFADTKPAFAAMDDDVSRKTKGQLRKLLDGGVNVDGRTGAGETLLLYGLRKTLESHEEHISSGCDVASCIHTGRHGYLHAVRDIARGTAADHGAVDGAGNNVYHYLLCLPFIDHEQSDVSAPSYLRTTPNKEGITPVSKAVNHMIDLASVQPTPSLHGAAAATRP